MLLDCYQFSFRLQQAISSYVWGKQVSVPLTSVLLRVSYISSVVR